MPERRKQPDELRSHRWFGVDTLRAFGHRSRMMEMGCAREDFRRKPVIGIVNTWSETSTCHSHLRQRADGRLPPHPADGGRRPSGCDFDFPHAGAPTPEPKIF